MSNAQQIIIRFSMYTSFKDSPTRTGVTLATESNRVLSSVLEHLVDLDSDDEPDKLARLFLKGLIEASQTYNFFLRVNSPGNEISALIVYWQLCQNFLFSYLQLICWQVARQISNNLRTSPNINLHYSLEDCFLLASELSLKPAKLLKNFDFNSNFSVEGYARTALARTVKNRVVKEVGSKTVKFSDNGLLRNITKTKLEKSLRAYGISVK